MFYEQFSPFEFKVSIYVKLTTEFVKINFCLRA